MGENGMSRRRFKVKSPPLPRLQHGEEQPLPWQDPCIKPGPGKSHLCTPGGRWKPPHAVLDSHLKMQVWGFWSSSSTAPILHGGSLGRK